MDLIKPNFGQKPDPRSDDKDLEFMVMPKTNPNAPQPRVEPQPAIHQNPPPSAKPSPLTLPEEPKSNKLWIILGTALVIVILAVVGYFFYNKSTDTSKNTGNNNTSTPAPDTSAADLNKDTDKDGLTDTDEAKLGTSATNPDTDGDGVADGDEVHVYASDPLLLDSNANGYDDGQEIANGYSPVLKSADKATADIIQTWQTNIAQYGLHEPTITTLKLKVSNSQTDVPGPVYVNSVYKYSVQVPPILAYREGNAGQQLGIYIAGTTPQDTDVTGDPISITSAAKLPTQSIKDWINLQFPADQYGKTMDLVGGATAGIELVGVKNEVCPQNKTIFSKNSDVLIVTWTCNTMTPYEPYYDKIVKSFKFN
ncbi:hypothetical protein D4R52_00350 [bacterium]|nr:MAG: hypothetical protein D4R52_00350 [bacterium]